MCVLGVGTAPRSYGSVNSVIYYTIVSNVICQSRKNIYNKEIYGRDIAGHERFGHMTRVYYKYAIAAIICFDLSRPATFDSVLKWLNDVNSKVMLANEKPVPVMLLANKCDIEEVSIDSNMLSKFCKDHSFIGWFPTSAKTDVNIEKAMNFLTEHIMSLPTESTQPGEHIDLKTSSDLLSTQETFQSDEVERKSSCC
ncbi:ras-related protein Rab-32B-like isoform X3 [Gigantopelta aegis]|uniref:ras-related protein Rab-32B-like isoform X3 n=1 Tax=Gigantopelta aegis TaxID=1735272 RepID=UPI001B8891E6|nr:ras-related protein Rab-32B-like isoform X3 [Gigantopelta aegis]